MTKMAARPVYVKTLKSPLLNRKSYDLETLHVSLGTQDPKRFEN